jgi:hypothetical protein
VVTVDVRAIVLADAPTNSVASESLGGVPLALLPVLGIPVIHQVLDRLLRSSIDGVAVISEALPAPYFRPAPRAGVKWIEVGANGDLWRQVEATFNDFAQAGADLVLFLRLGPYLEFDPDALVQFHLDQKNRVTAVADKLGPLDTFVISASRRNDAAYMFRHQLAAFRSPCGVFLNKGYANRLRNAADLRQLALDSLAFVTAVRPAGTQIKPGVWVEPGARIHPRARVLAPAFVGAYSKIRAAVVLTRGAVVEHHSEIDCGTVVEDASVLPFTYVGAGLDLSHAVAGLQQLASLKRKVAIDISDPKLMGRAPAAAPLRVLNAAGSLIAYLPRQILRGLFAPSQREPLTELPASVNSPHPALQAQTAGLEGGAVADTEAPKFPANLVVARRYGDQ